MNDKRIFIVNFKKTKFAFLPLVEKTSFEGVMLADNGNGEANFVHILVDLRDFDEDLLLERCKKAGYESCEEYFDACFDNNTALYNLFKENNLHKAVFAMLMADGETVDKNDGEEVFAFYCDDFAERCQEQNAHISNTTTNESNDDNEDSGVQNLLNAISVCNSEDDKDDKHGDNDNDFYYDMEELADAKIQIDAGDVHICTKNLSLHITKSDIPCFYRSQLTIKFPSNGYTTVTTNETNVSALMIGFLYDEAQNVMGCSFEEYLDDLKCVGFEKLVKENLNDIKQNKKDMPDYLSIAIILLMDFGTHIAQ